MLLDSAIERLYALHTGITPLDEGAPHEKPHKPLLLLAALDLIDEGSARALACRFRRPRRNLSPRREKPCCHPIPHPSSARARMTTRDGACAPLPDISFIDAAHLIPFAASRNDHPTNGLALCKNHHWAMDHQLIAPCPGIAEGVAGRAPYWHVSKLIDPRRSNGEKELVELAGKSLLLPKDQAFYPDSEGLNWRLKRLTA